MAVVVDGYSGAKGSFTLGIWMVDESGLVRLQPSADERMRMGMTPPRIG